jgi:DNA gyrase subunit A
MFATRSGSVRRNELSDFIQINRNGKIAMKFEGDDEGDAIVGVHTCTEDDDVLLTAANGRCIRFPVTQVRVFSGRSSTGVRGIRLEGDDKIIAMSILRHVDVTPAEARAYQKQAGAMRRAVIGEGDEAEVEIVGAIEVEDVDDDAAEDLTLTPERYTELGAREQFVLTVSEKGFGKRSSSYDYRTSGRGGKGIIAMTVTARNGKLIASFPVEDHDQIMLVTDAGQLIRCPVDDVRVAGRATQGVTIFRTTAEEHVVSVERVDESSENGDHGDADEQGASDDASEN